MKQQFPLFQTHIDLAHSYWKQLLQTGDFVIDATCGNGNDSLVLATLTLAEEEGKLFAIDLQEHAIRTTKELIKRKISPSLQRQIIFLHQSHCSFPDEITPSSIKLIVYNLGYLPKSDKLCKTNASSTLKSLEQAKSLIIPGGALSITCYPGHAEGEEEKEAIAEWASSLAPDEWSVCEHSWPNRKKAPVLYFIQRNEAALQR